MSTVSIPNYRFSGTYYPEILQDLLVWLRTNVPEISDEDPNEPFIQLLRAYALVGHLNNVLLDHVALETLLPTARLRESVRGQLALIGYELKQPTPAVAEMLLELSSPKTVAGSIRTRALFGTTATETVPEILYETQAALDYARTDQLAAAFEYDESLATYTDRTANAISAADTWTAWPGAPTPPTALDLLYFGHGTALWNQIDLDMDTAGDIWAAADHVWEYYHGIVDDVTPTSVVYTPPAFPLPAKLTFDLTPLLGTSDRHGAQVTIRSTRTGKAETVTSDWSGGVNKADTTVLGQSTVSLTASHYTVGSLWREPANVLETTAGTVRTVAYDFPETLTRQWKTVAINGTTAYWLRLRVVNTTLVNPVIREVQIHNGAQYFKINATQGQTAIEDPLASSTGLADQSYTTSHADVIDGTMVVTVDEGAGATAWSEVVDLLSSTTASRHYVVSYSEDGTAVITFGDGTNGKIPVLGVDNIATTYRWGAATGGNVGAAEITGNRSGLSMASVTNPRPAAGWQPADGATDEDLARLKVAGPASLRALHRALTADDVETVVAEFVAADGTSPVERAIGLEEVDGPKTVRVVVVGGGGNAVPDEYLTEIETYLNGSVVTGVSGVLVLNTEATVVNFTQNEIDVQADVTGGDVLLINAVLNAFLSPIAKDDDGNYIHNPGGTIYRSRIIAEIFNADPGNVKNVDLIDPGTDIVLTASELPYPGNMAITIV